MAVRNGKPSLRHTFFDPDVRIFSLPCIGVMGLPERILSKQGHELQFATNHLGHFLLFQLLKDTLIQSATPEFPSKVVNLSSNGHRLGPVHFEDLTLESNYDRWAAYGQSKLSNIWMANYVERWGDTCV